MLLPAARLRLFWAGSGKYTSVMDHSYPSDQVHGMHFELPSIPERMLALDNVDFLQLFAS